MALNTILLAIEAVDEASQIINGITSALADFVNEAADAEVISTRFNAVLRGSDAAGMGQELLDLADSMSKVTRFDDEAIIAAETMALKYENISNDVLPSLIETSADLAEVLGEDISGAANMLGRSFADIANGSLTMLYRQKLITSATKDAAEAMAKNGDVAGAQKMILDELQAKYGTVAEEIGNTFVGEMAKLDTIFGNIKESIGEQLLPILTPLVEKFGELALKIGPQLAALFGGKIIPLFKKAGDVLMNLMGGGNMGSLFGDIGSVLSSVLAAIQPGLDGFRQAWATIYPMIQLVFGIIAERLTPVLQNLAAQVIPFLVGVFNQLGRWFADNSPLIGKFISVIMLAFSVIIEQAALAWAWVQPLLQGIIDLVLGLAKVIMQLATGDWAGAWATIKDTASKVWASLKLAFAAFANWITSWFGTSWTNVVRLWQGNWDKLVAIVLLIKTKLIDAGKAIVEGLLQGIQDSWQTVVDWLTKAISALIDAMLGALDSGSPSRVFMRIGQSIGDGLAIGIRQSMPGAQAALMAGLSGMTLSPQVAMSAGMAGGRNRMALHNYGHINVNLQGGDQQNAQTFLEQLSIVMGA